MNYQTYEVSVATNTGLRFLEVTACDLQAAHADVVAAFGADVEIVCSRVL